MPKKINKPKANKSKRLRLKTKYSISKKVKEYNKKMKKEARKMKSLGLPTQKKEKEEHIPNMFPFKARIIEEQEQRRMEEQELRREQRQERKQQMKEEQQRMDMENYEKSYQLMQENTNKQNKSIPEEKMTFRKQMNKVIKQADIILNVMDTRNPQRNVEIEQQISEQKKKIIYILNKVDLVGLNNAQQWQNQLQSINPCVLMRANNMKQGDKTEDIKMNQIISGSQLIEYIKKQSKLVIKKKSITIGVIGFNNSGKQTLINNLKQYFIEEAEQNDKKLEMVFIDQKVKLITVKGTITTKQNELTRLVNLTIRPDQVDDIQSAVQKIVETVNNNKQLMLMYRIPDFDDYKGFLMNICQQQQRLKKGEIADIDEAGRLVINDWLMGRIKYSKQANL